MTFSFAKDEHLIYASVMGSRENGVATCKEQCWTLQKWASLGFAKPPFKFEDATPITSTDHMITQS
jgi:hypothetical protein